LTTPTFKPNGSELHKTTVTHCEHAMQVGKYSWSTALFRPGSDVYRIHSCKICFTAIHGKLFLRYLDCWVSYILRHV